MIKVLAAELSDQGRLSRGKRYWAEDAVVDIVVGHGAVTAVIQGSRPDPYVVTIEATEGTGVPSKREVWITCTCPDDGVETEACKHAVAALFALSDEVAIEPALIERWRTGSAQAAPGGRDRSRRGRATATRAADGRTRAPIPSRHPAIRSPTSWRCCSAPPTEPSPPEFPDVTPIQHTDIRDRQLSDVLADAIEHLAIDWGDVQGSGRGQPLRLPPSSPSPLGIDAARLTRSTVRAYSPRP